MKNISLILFNLLVFVSVSAAQKNYQAILDSNTVFRNQINKEYRDSATSPLTNRDRQRFEGLPFFPVDTAFYVVAQFEKAKKARSFKMKTTTSRRPVYEKFGVATFEIKGKTYDLNIYQSQALKKKQGLENYLFLPFKDLSNGETTYGGGRFIDLKIPDGDTIIIDFNKAYNPYCVYNHIYSCPIPPKDNFLNVAIEAGVKHSEND